MSCVAMSCRDTPAWIQSREETSARGELDSLSRGETSASSELDSQKKSSSRPEGSGRWTTVGDRVETLEKRVRFDLRELCTTIAGFCYLPKTSVELPKDSGDIWMTAGVA
jgi:hypothetical protein